MRLATFNVENLFTRFLFARGVDRREAGQKGFTSEDLRFRVADAASKRLTAETMLAVDADVFALQEVEGMDVLKQFRDRYLGGAEAWPHAFVVDGNDSRRIDVGVLSKLPIVHARTWQHLREDGEFVFDRDCLEVDVLGPAGPITLYVNHFKSMRAPNRAQGSGRALTRARRAQQVRAVRRIVCERFGEDPSDGSIVILGDLNDYVLDDRQGKSAIRELVEWEAVVDVVGRLPPGERWTHHFQGRRNPPLEPGYRQLDFVLPSRRLAELHPGSPRIERRGMAERADRYTGPRFEGVGRHRPKASDHCPVVFDVDLA